MRSKLILLAAAALVVSSVSAMAQNRMAPRDRDELRAAPPAVVVPVEPLTTGRAIRPEDQVLDPPRGAVGDDPPGSRIQDRGQREDSGAEPEGRR